MKFFFVKILRVFKNVASDPEFGRDFMWPTPPAVLADFVLKLKYVHQRWRARMIISRFAWEAWTSNSVNLSYNFSDILLHLSNHDKSGYVTTTSRCALVTFFFLLLGIILTFIVASSSSSFYFILFNYLFFFLVLTILFP